MGDIAVQYDPAHASLPWAGVRLLLEVRAVHVVPSYLPPYMLTRVDDLIDHNQGHSDLWSYARGTRDHCQSATSIYHLRGLVPAEALSCVGEIEGLTDNALFQRLDLLGKEHSFLWEGYHETCGI